MSAVCLLGHPLSHQNPANLLALSFPTGQNAKECKEKSTLLSFIQCTVHFATSKWLQADKYHDPWF